MSISMISAMDRNRVIGLNNRMPWRLPNDLKYFRKMTWGHDILMGRKTFESLGKPLDGRTNIILTANRQYQAAGTIVMHAVDEVLQTYEAKDLFITGGAEIYKLFMPYANKLFITKIDEIFEGDTWFPEIDEQVWKLVSEEQGATDEKSIYPHQFMIYERLNK